MVDDGLRVVAEPVAFRERLLKPVGLLVVHEEALVEEADLSKGGRGDEGAAEARRLEVARLIGGGAIRLAVVGVLEEAESPVEAAGVGADERGVVVVEDLGDDDGARTGGGDERRQEVVGQHRVVVEDEDVVEAGVEAVADAGVVAAGGAPVLGLAEEDGFGEEALQLLGGAVARAVVDDNEAVVGVIDAGERAGEVADEGGAVVVHDNDAHGRGIICAAFGLVHQIGRRPSRDGHILSSAGVKQ